jgi:UDP-2,3-diacylglucosamine pyrophosphatase LpxH
MTRIAYLQRVFMSVPFRPARRPAMQTNQQSRSATILAFPAAARRSALILSNKAKFAAELAALKEKHADIDGWYHQAAIEAEATKPHS